MLLATVEPPNKGHAWDSAFHVLYKGCPLLEVTNICLEICPPFGVSFIGSPTQLYACVLWREGHRLSSVCTPCHGGLPLQIRQAVAIGIHNSNMLNCADMQVCCMHYRVTLTYFHHYHHKGQSKESQLKLYSLNCYFHKPFLQ